jgi:death-on-curing protein
MKHLKAWELTRLNEKLLSQYGGLKITRSSNQDARVEALCCRIRSLFEYGDDRTLAGTAALYCEVIARGHAFGDANKRTAVNALYLFLHRNSQSTRVPAGLSDVIVKVATGEMTRNQLTDFVQREIIDSNSSITATGH